MCMGIILEKTNNELVKTECRGFLSQAGISEVYNGGGLGDMRIQLM